jgi:hypothetical protein
MLDRQSRSQDTITGTGSADHRLEDSDTSTGRSPTPGKIGFVRLGHMGAAMARLSGTKHLGSRRSQHALGDGQACAYALYYHNLNLILSQLELDNTTT